MVDQVMETKVVDTVEEEEEGVMFTVKEDILVEVTMVVVGTTMKLEMIVDSNHPIMDPWGQFGWKKLRRPCGSGGGSGGYGSRRFYSKT